MGLDNKISVEFTEEELTDLINSLENARAILTSKAINLTPKERQKYSRVKYELEDWVSRTHTYMKAHPELVPHYINIPEHEKDIEARKHLSQMLNLTKQILEMIDDTHLMLGNDIFNNSIAFYRNIKNASQQNVPGITNIYQDLQQQFPGRPKKQDE